MAATINTAETTKNPPVKLPVTREPSFVDMAKVPPVIPQTVHAASGSLVTRACQKPRSPADPFAVPAKVLTPVDGTPNRKPATW